MTDKTEVLIKETLHRQADRAPDAVALLMRIEARQARSRPRRAVLVGATAAVAALLAVGAVLVAGPGGSSGQNQSAAAQHHSGFAFQPHWLPAGLVEKARQSRGAETSRLWTTSEGVVTEGGEADWQFATGHTIRLSTQPGSMPTGNNHTIDINGHPGKVTSLATTVYEVTWEPEPGVILTVRGADGQPNFSYTPEHTQSPAEGDKVLADVLRVARSVQPDDHDARIDPQITFGKLPQGWTPLAVGVSGDNPRNSDTQLQVRVRTGSYDFIAFLDWQPSTYRPKPDVHANDNIGKLPDGSFLLVGLHVDAPGEPTPPMKTMVQMASQAIQEHPQADVSWLGTP
ncbi:hypothetical protein [Labedaea rhizosphaerae]|uniref:Uncharacterized protein n=1 Tax=Labedaea rhizosphaerae TaxID=598644 RepID=A0A4R6S3X6_LABRH|nr:hypothetical protein [Labedaea rhizosphaerae]TDP93787.1 hypothetical protein EV186_106181 [Labedaea rhizosphaerae]